ncbi:MAG: SiaB family protein kinase [Flavobacteriales bacterium]|nr:SiaB family protein kinase [Flavobacteriales bacterium]
MTNLSSRYVYTLFEDLKDHEILMCYFGNVSFKISNHLINTLKENLDSDKMERVIFKKVYSSFVECIENITRHTSEDIDSGDRFGIVNVSKRGDYIVIHSGNMVKMDIIEDLERRISPLKTQTQEEIRKAYQKQLVEGELSDKGGAGLGMLQIALNSDGNLDYEFQDVDDEKKFFLLEVRIKLS